MVYLPVYVASAVAVHREQIVKRRAAVAPKLLLGTARSSAFLAVYVACAHRGAFLPGGLLVRGAGWPALLALAHTLQRYACHSAACFTLSICSPAALSLVFQCMVALLVHVARQHALAAVQWCAGRTG